MKQLKYRILHRLWHWWHCDLRWWHDKQFNNGEWNFRDRPYWHMCCNGDDGGWRTDVCNWMEIRWRRLENELEG